MAIPVYLWLKDDGGADIKGSVDVKDREGSIEVVAQEHNLYIPTDNNTGNLNIRISRRQCASILWGSITASGANIRIRRLIRREGRITRRSICSGWLAWASGDVRQRQERRCRAFWQCSLRYCCRGGQQRGWRRW